MASKKNGAGQQDGAGDPKLEAEALFGGDGPFATFLRNMNPKTMAEQGIELTKNLFQIAWGQSDIAPDPRDARFKDRAFQDNPYYKRLAQAYLAMTEAVEAMIPDDLSVENKQRAQLAASIVTSTMAPTNTLLGNPAAMTRTLETGGSNLARGFQNFMKDMKENRAAARDVRADRIQALYRQGP